MSNDAVVSKKLNAKAKTLYLMDTDRCYQRSLVSCYLFHSYAFVPSHTLWRLRDTSL